MATKNESAEKYKCQARTYPPGVYWSAACGKTAAYEHEGVLYCKTHHPPNVKAKREAKHAKWNAEYDVRIDAINAKDDELAAIRKDAELYRWLESQCASGVLTVASVHEFGLAPWSGDDLTGKIAAEMAKRSA